MGRREATEVWVCDEDVAYALEIGRRRHCAKASRTPDAGRDAVHLDEVGALAEVAVCRHLGLDPYEWVVCHEERPGAIPDLVYQGWTVSVKGTDRWVEPLTLFFGVRDRNRIGILVSVDTTSGRCALWGWMKRGEILTYPLKDSPRSGMYHWVPARSLHPFTAPL